MCKHTHTHHIITQSTAWNSIRLLTPFEKSFTDLWKKKKRKKKKNNKSIALEIPHIMRFRGERDARVVSIFFNINTYKSENLHILTSQTEKKCDKFFHLTLSFTFLLFRFWWNRCTAAFKCHFINETTDRQRDKRNRVEKVTVTTAQSYINLTTIKK